MPGRRVAVGVVDSGGCDRDPGADGGQEPGVLIGRAVMRHLQHVGPRHASGQQRGLRVGLDVAGEQHPQPTGLRQQHGRLLFGSLSVPRSTRAGPITSNCTPPADHR